MIDVIAFEVETFEPNAPRRQYPSVNSTGGDSFRGGKKTPEYRSLFRRLKEAAEAEIARLGWATAEHRVEGHIRRYVPNRRDSDASNLGKVEWDALEAAGVYRNDSQVRPFPDVVYDPTPGAVDRIAIALFRLPPHPCEVGADAKPPKRIRSVAQKAPGTPRRALPSLESAIALPDAPEAPPRPARGVRTLDEITRAGGVMTTAEYEHHKVAILGGGQPAPPPRGPRSR